MEKVTKAIIPAAGLGTRFLPATKALPKEMLPIVDKPAIQFIVEEAIASGITDIMIITGRGKRAIEDHFDKSYELESELARKKKRDLLKIVEEVTRLADIHYIRQKEPKGLGHAVMCAKSFIGNEPFAVMLGDDIMDAKIPCLKQMIDIYNRYNAPILGVQRVSEDDISRYGCVDASLIEEQVYKVNDLIEKPSKNEAPSNIAILGRYILDSDIFQYIKDASTSVDQEIQLTDALKSLATHRAVYAYNFEGKRYDVGDRLGFLSATVDFALKRDDINAKFVEYLRKILGRLDD